MDAGLLIEAIIGVWGRPTSSIGRPIADMMMNSRHPNDDDDIATKLYHKVLQRCIGAFIP